MDWRFLLADRIFKVILAVVTIPLLLGGLVAAGEVNDARVLIYGAISLLLLAMVSLTRRMKAD